MDTWARERSTYSKLIAMIPSNVFHIPNDFSYLPKKEMTTKEMIINAIADIDFAFKIKTKTRKREIVLPRQYTLYLLDVYFNISQEEITSLIGGFKNRCTIVHAKRCILTLLDTKQGTIELYPYMKAIDKIFLDHKIIYWKEAMTEDDFDEKFETFEAYKVRMKSQIKSLKTYNAEIKKKLEKSLALQKDATDEVKRLKRMLERRKKP